MKFHIFTYKIFISDLLSKINVEIKVQIINSESMVFKINF